MHLQESTQPITVYLVIVFPVVVIVSVVLDAYGSLLMMAWLWQVWFIRQQVCLPPIAKALLRLYSPPVTLEHLVVLVQVT